MMPTRTMIYLAKELHDRSYCYNYGKGSQLWRGVWEMWANPQDQVKKQLLHSCRKIAVVGITNDPEKPSHYVPRYLQEQGYRIVPVNPFLQEVLGEKAYPDLKSIPFKVDVVDVFRRSEAIFDIAKQAQELNIPAVWVQLHIECSSETVEFAKQHHLLLVKDA